MAKSTNKELATKDLPKVLTEPTSLATEGPKEYREVQMVLPIEVRVRLVNPLAPEVVKPSMVSEGATIREEAYLKFKKKIKVNDGREITKERSDLKDRRAPLSVAIKK